MRKLFEIGGLVASVVLIAFGVGALVIGIQGRSTVHHSLGLEQIVGTPDMTPAAISKAAEEAGLKNVDIPSIAVAGEKIDNGEKARAFAGYMRIHALEATGGLTYSQMPRFATADGKGTNDPAAALKTPSGAPQDNPARQIWVTETALSTALNTSYMAEQTALFGVVVGVALLLSGLGFAILAIGGALRNPETAIKALRPKSHVTGKAVPTA